MNCEELAGQVSVKKRASQSGLDVTFMPLTLGKNKGLLDLVLGKRSSLLGTVLRCRSIFSLLEKASERRVFEKRRSYQAELTERS
jgi:hypothetical protein